MPNRNPYAVFGTSVTSAEDLSNKSFSATQYLLLVCGGYLGTVVSGAVFGLLFGFIIGLLIGPILAFIAGLVPFTLAALFAPARTSVKGTFLICGTTGAATGLLSSFFWIPLPGMLIATALGFAGGWIGGFCVAFTLGLWNPNESHSAEEVS